MSDRKVKQLRNLSAIAELLKNAALAELATATQACDITRSRISALEAPMPPTSSLPMPTMEAAALLHRRWSEPRRLRLNEELALQSARRITCEALARRALGRSEVIDKLYSRQRSDKRHQ